MKRQQKSRAVKESKWRRRQMHLSSASLYSDFVFFVTTFRRRVSGGARENALAVSIRKAFGLVHERAFARVPSVTLICVEAMI